MRTPNDGPLDLRILDYDEVLRPRATAPGVNEDSLCTAVCEGAPCTSGEVDLEPPAM
jgi:hypothetical protein